MTVTTGLSAVEALTKAKNEGGYAVCSRHFNYRWSQKRGVLTCEELNGTWEYPMDPDNNIPPEWIIDLNWEYHAPNAD